MKITGRYEMLYVVISPLGSFLCRDYRLANAISKAVKGKIWNHYQGK